MKPALIIFFVLLRIGANAQTCIIIYVGDKGIIAGADRKYRQVVANTNTVNGKQQTNHSVYYGKKIFINNNCYWAMSGTDYYDSIHAICRQVSKENWPLQKIINRLQQRLQRQTISNAMHELFLLSNQEQKNRFKANMTEIAFFKFDGNAYKAYRITISMPGVFQKKETLHFDVDSIVSTKRTVGVFVLGHSGALGNNLQPERWIDPVTTIKKLIIKQSRATPADVSPGSDIIRITKNAFTWMNAR